MSSEELFVRLSNKFFKKYGNRGYKFIKLANKYFVDEMRKDLISKFQSVGAAIQMTGENWHVNLPEHVIIGNNVKIGGAIYFEAEGGIIIGDGTRISSGVTIITADSNNQKKQVQIGKQVWIGANVSINAGVTIGDGAKIGMGSVINSDIQSNEYVNMPDNQPQESKVSPEKSNCFPTYLDIPSQRVCFVLGTGRCGSKSIAKNLNKHTDIFAQHENIRQFIRLSTEYAHGSKQKSTVKREIIDLFKAKTINPPHFNSLLVHSDQRFWNMVPLLSEIFPDARFIHLIRDGRDTVRSMFARDWFADNELVIKRNNKDKQWAEYRLNGYLAGDVEKQKWNTWSAFERCCWYWSFINNSIESELKKKENKYLLKLELVENEMPALLNFLGVKREDISFETYNRRKKIYKKKYQFEWNDKKEEKFQKIAGNTQLKFYGNR